VNLTGKEVHFDRDDLIVSKTDLQGKITYANHTFLKVAGYEEAECIGQQHNLIRNPNMPRAVFDLLWTTVKEGKEIFAYVVNSTKTGDYYWVVAHVTPSVLNGQTVGYHSTRRVPNPDTIRNTIVPLYDRLLDIEARNPSKKDGLHDSVGALHGVLSEKGVSYDEFMAGLMRND
jgi:PAS domain S-box-containing protein